MKYARVMAPVLLAALGTGVALRRAAPPAHPVAVLIVVDQLGPDDLVAARGRFGRDGFLGAERDGFAVPDFELPNAVTFTCPGHALLFTGRTGDRTGMTGNRWLDPVSRAAGRCGKDCRVECDAGTPGGSALRGGALRIETIADRLLSGSPGAEVIGVALKTAPVALLSRAPSARLFALDDAGTAFVELDGGAHGQDRRPLKLGDPVWRDGGRAGEGEPDDAAWERPPDGWTRVFPHRVPARGAPGYADLAAMHPGAARAQTDLALALARNAGRAGPGLLVISYSGYDLVAHAFGRHSREAREYLVRLDGEVARVRRWLRRRGGCWRLVITSDHGSQESPERRAAREGADAAGRVAAAEVRSRVEAALSRSFGPAPGGAWVLDFAAPHLYLDRAALGRRLVPAQEIAEYALRRMDRIGAVFPADGVCALDADLARRACLDIDPERSGDLLIFPARGWEWSSNQAGQHGTPWPEDRRIPLIIEPRRAGEAPRAGANATCVAAQLAAALEIGPDLAAPAPCLAGGGLAK